MREKGVKIETERLPVDQTRGRGCRPTPSKDSVLCEGATPSYGHPKLISIKLCLGGDNDHLTVTGKIG